MGFPKISTFIVGLIVVSFIIGSFSLFISEGSKSANLKYDNTSLEGLNQMNNITSMSAEIKDKTDIREKSNVFDIIGGYFSSGFTALKITFKSFDIFDYMANEGLKQAHLGKAGVLFRDAMIAIVLIIIFVGVVLSTILKREI